MTDREILLMHKRIIDDKTNDLLDLADELERNNMNVKLDDGSYLNLVSTIRVKVDVIWDEVLAMVDEVYDKMD